MMGYRYGMMGWGGTIVSILFIALIIFTGIKLIQSAKGNDIGKGKNSALDILNQRFARGEISEEEYIQKKKTLRE